MEFPQKIKIVKLEDPSRIYFDLSNTILTMKNTSWTMANSVLKEVKIAQTSTEPNIVRIVITSDADLSKMVVMQMPSVQYTIMFLVYILQSILRILTSIFATALHAILKTGNS